MHRFLIQWLSLVFCFGLLVGCGDDVDPLSQAEQAAKPKSADGDSSTTDSSDTKTDDEATAAVADRPRIKIPEREKKTVRRTVTRESMTGRWVLHLVQVMENPNPQEGQAIAQFGERPVLLISVTAGEGESDNGSISIIASREMFAEVTITDAKVTKDTISFQCMDADGHKVAQIKGSLLNTGVVLGAIMSQGNAGPTRLLPTEEKTFARIPAFVVLDEQVEMMRLESSPVPEEDVLQFARDYPDSPLPSLAFRFTVQGLAKGNKPARVLDRLVEGYIKTQANWGTLLEKQAPVEALSWIASVGYDPEYCLAMADKIEPTLDGSEGVEHLPKQVKDMRRGLRYTLALQQIMSPKEATKEAGRKAVREWLIEAPFDPILIVNLADDARIAGRNDEAIDLYAQLVAMPMQEQYLREVWTQDPIKKLMPSERLAKLWKDNKTGFKDIDGYLAKVYGDNFLRFADKRLNARPNAEGNKVVLCELFTSSDNPSCIGTSVATSGLQQTYGDSMVVVLRYHQQFNTAIDPLANEESEIRCFNYYRAGGSPALLLNGVPQGSIAGPLAVVPMIYKNLRTTIDTLLEAKTEVKIVLTADRSGHEIRISANVTEADPENKSLRLRIALAESDVAFTSSTGIRQHDMVVRKMIGGEGIAATEAGFVHEETVDVNAVRASLDAYLKRFEDNYSKKLTEKPLDLKQLYVVAFVQDDSTREVLQSIVVPVKSAE